MRESYSVHSLADEWIRITPERGASPDLQGAALLLIDLQTAFLDPASPLFLPSSISMIPGLMKLRTVCAGRGRPVILTRHVDEPDPHSPMQRWWERSLTTDDPLSRIDPRFSPEPGETLIQKATYDAFKDSPLDRHLKSAGVTKVVIGGVMTHLCCETTARSAFLRGYSVLFLSDGTATISRRHHMATLDNLSHGFARIVRTGDILDATSA